MQTWNSNRAASTPWPRDSGTPHEEAPGDPLSRFSLAVDRLFYVALAAFMAGVVVLIID